MAPRARIALTLATNDTELRRRAGQRYIDALERVGAQVIAVAPGDVPPDEFDGLCLSGGEDVEPGRGEAARIFEAFVQAARSVTAR